MIRTNKVRLLSAETSSGTSSYMTTKKMNFGQCATCVEFNIEMEKS